VLAEKQPERISRRATISFGQRAPGPLSLAEIPGKLIVAGGHYASCSAEALMEHHPELDIIVIHEGEQTLLEIVALRPILRTVAEE
jgi:radical SAM superfamily enzyme YgiQ (UPF0313 family)